MTQLNQQLIGILLLLISVGCGSTERIVDPKGGPYTGPISASKLLQGYGHFRVAYEEYQPQDQELKAITALSGKSILVLFGTWCHDSEREVPRLLKLLDTANVKLQSLELHGVNYLKRDPNQLHEKYQLRHSPTIILLDGDQELGRIVEKPDTSLGEDLADFVVNP